MKLLHKIKSKYNNWCDARFLKRHNCSSWEQYNRMYDPDHNYRATRIKHFYSGYPHVYCFENHSHEIYFWDLGYDGTYVANKWCKENLKGKFRFDFHRAMKAPATAYEWEINELCGGDYIFFACKDERDFIHFMLRWS